MRRRLPVRRGLAIRLEPVDRGVSEGANAERQARLRRCRRAASGWAARSPGRLRLRRDADEEEQAGHDLLEEREVLRAVTLGISCTVRPRRRRARAWAASPR